MTAFICLLIGTALVASCVQGKAQPTRKVRNTTVVGGVPPEQPSEPGQ